MAFQFPDDKQDFKAPNGITYTYSDGTWVVKSYGEKIDLSPYVQQDVFDADQSRQDTALANEAATNETQSDQINLLETQIQLLAQARAVGKWKYVRNVSNGPRPPATATFYATNGFDSSFVVRDWADARLIMIDKTDLNGTSYTFSTFEEGDKIEILDTDGSSACYGTVTNQPNVETYGNLIIAVERSTSGPRDDKEYIISVYRPGAVSGGVDLDILDNRYLVKTGDTMEAPLNFQRGTKDSVQFKISPNNGEDFATNIYSFYGQMRFRTTHTNNEGDHVGSHIVLSSNGGSPETKIYHVTEAGDTAAVPKSYVDSHAGVPVGTIMIWLNSAAPDGWFKLHGADFDTSVYPLLHTYLLTTDSYTAGKLPDWSGRYPGEYGDHLAGVSLGKKSGQRTAMPDAGAPYHPNSIPNGSTRTFTSTGNTNAYSNGTARPAISEGWDNVTRPPTVVVHYIIKHD